MITVKQARELVLAYFGLKANEGKLLGASLDHKTYVLIQSRLIKWLHLISAKHMENVYGSDYSSNPLLPDDIDAATYLSLEQSKEFIVRLKELP